jgi:hypothetical protein
LVAAKRIPSYLRSLDPQLPRDVWVLQIGGLVNAFGNGIVLPFLIIYLHNVRGSHWGSRDSSRRRTPSAGSLRGSRRERSPIASARVACSWARCA